MALTDRIEVRNMRGCNGQRRLGLLWGGGLMLFEDSSENVPREKLGKIRVTRDTAGVSSLAVLLVGPPSELRVGDLYPDTLNYVG